jgi:hypothetical protein
MRLPAFHASVFRALPTGFRKVLTGRSASCIGAVLLVGAAFGFTWFSLGGILLACGILGFQTREGVRVPAALMCGLAALLGPQPAAWTVLTAAALLLSMEGEGFLSRLVPAAAVPVALLDGSVSGLQAAAAASILSAVLPDRRLRWVLGFGGVLSGVLVLGPPLPSVSVPFYPEHVVDRFPLYDWHDPVAVDLGCPLVILNPQGSPPSPLSVIANADLPTDGSIDAWIRMGDTILQVDSGKGIFELPGESPDPLEFRLEGSWSPFLNSQVMITWIEQEGEP